ncbi:heme-binding protein [Exiguobacterium sp. NPDC077395]|uniref:heme-binding protein n=1 Tax=Exiguobacterium sp. NPDC077395 TaxID=3390563 RepID=UPI003D039D9C
MNTTQLQAQEEQLTLSTFGHEEALQLGQTIIDLAKEDGVNVAVHIEKNRIPVFTHLMEGTTEENYMWLFRKKRVTDHYQRGSHFIAKRFEESGLSHDTNSLLPANDYQAIGGTLPIRVNGAGMIGTVTVAGLTPELDHEYAVRGMERFRQYQN